MPADKIVIEINLAEVFVADGDNGKTFAQHIADTVAHRLLKDAAKGDYWDAVKDRVTRIRDEEIRAALVPLIEEALASNVESVYGAKPTPLKQHIVNIVKDELKWKDKSHSSYDRSPFTRFVHDEIDTVLRKELSEDIAAAKKQVREAVRAKGAEMLAQTIEQMAAGR